MKKLLGSLVLLLLLSACSSNQYADMTFQEVCSQSGGMWMKMHPTMNYIPTGQLACYGCMQPTGDHICDRQRYIQTLSVQS